ncbi:protein toll [Caerostris extrusa]|uniref:Protein toll n=1 Tax=Caerostris extrusa TaxID=172846 RepID=A0AAV4PHG3_CAEEX|nr:protein toll [Caerostris extrusa]
MEGGKDFPLPWDLVASWPTLYQPLPFKIKRKDIKNYIPRNSWNSTVLEIFLPRANKEVPFVIEAEIEGLNLSNNKIQSFGRGSFFSITVLYVSFPVFLLESLEFRTRVTLSNNPWACDCAALDFKKWLVSKSILVLDMNKARCGPDMPNNPGLAERAILLLPDRGTLPGQHRPLHLHGFRRCQGVTAKEIREQSERFAVGGGRWNNRLDAVQDECEGVALLTRSDLSQGKDIDRDKEFDAFISFSYKDQDLVIQELIEGECFARSSQLRYDRFEDSDRRKGPGYQAVPSLQTLPPGEWCLLEFNAAHGQALKDQVPRIIVIKLPDLPKDDELPKEIQLYLNSTTYLTWGEKHFWNKLLYILPRSQSVQKPKSRDEARHQIPMRDFSA